MFSTVAEGQHALRRWMALAMLALVGCTARLWFGGTAFPQVPLLAFARGAPAWLDALAVALMGAGWLAAAAAPVRAVRMWKGALVVSLIGSALAVALNQHAFQPWVWLHALFALSMIGLPPREALRWQRLVVAAVYLFSAASKLDYTFLHEFAMRAAGAFLTPLGFEFDHWPTAARLAAALMLPTLEIAAGIGFLWPRLHAWALAVSLAMHLMMLAALSPWGLDHRPGVLVWNAYFLGQNTLLWLCDRARRKEAATHDAALELPPSAWLVVATRVGLALACVWPLSEPLGYCDAWPAWNLYAVRNERMLVYIEADGAPRLPAEFLDRGPPGWVQLRIDRMSLDLLHAPLYPDRRFQTGVVLGLCERFHVPLDSVAIVSLGVADRFDGVRPGEQLTGEELAATADEYWFNALPRR